MAAENENGFIDTEDLRFTMQDASGATTEYRALFMFEAPEFNRHYMVYTDGSVNTRGEQNVTAAVFDPSGLKTQDGAVVGISLEPIRTQVEWDMVGRKLAEFEELEEQGQQGQE